MTDALFPIMVYQGIRFLKLLTFLLYISPLNLVPDDSIPPAKSHTR